MSETTEPLVNFSIKLKPSEIEEFQLFKRDLQDLVQVGKVTTRAAFLFAVGSGTARLAKEGVPGLQPKGRSKA